MPSNHKPSHTTHSHRGRPSAGSSSGRQRQNKLRELLSMGIPRRLAQQVASGHRDLSDILQEMARHEKVDKLVAEHDLPRSLAVQCVLGQADLKAYLSKRRRHEYRSEHGWRSVFQEAHQDAEPRTFAVLGRANRHVQVQAVDRYELDVVDANGGEPEKLHKQQIKLVYRDAAGVELEQSEVLSDMTPAWTWVAASQNLPIGARSVDFVLMGTRVSGSDNDAYFDDLRLTFARCGEPSP